VAGGLYHPQAGKRPQGAADDRMRDLDSPADRAASMFPAGPAEVPQNPHVRRAAQGLVEKPLGCTTILLVSHDAKW